MANKGPATNSSQFFFTFKAASHLDRKHTVFGKLVGGEEVLDALENIGVKPGTERPAKPIRITEVNIYQDPFEQYKNRQQKRRARQAAAAAGEKTDESQAKTKDDEVNWFGLKVGSDKNGVGGIGGGGVGKYLNVNTASAKRPAESMLDAGLSEDGKKKRKIGFGNFDGW